MIDYPFKLDFKFQKEVLNKIPKIIKIFVQNVQ